MSQTPKDLQGIFTVVWEGAGEVANLFPCPMAGSGPPKELLADVRPVSFYGLPSRAIHLVFYFTYSSKKVTCVT